MYAVWFRLNNARQIYLAGISLLENVNKRRYFEACLHFLASKRLLNQVRPSYESNTTGINREDDNSIPIDNLREETSN